MSAFPIFVMKKADRNLEVEANPELCFKLPDGIEVPGCGDIRKLQLLDKF